MSRLERHKSLGRVATRGRIGVVALACSLYVACVERDGSDSTAGDGAATSADAEAGSSAQSESTGAPPDPAAIQPACEATCEMANGCDPEFIPTYYESLEDCVVQCIEGLELDYSDGCGPAQLMRLMCWADLTCEEWFALIETGYSPCGDDPGTQWCTD